MELSTIESLVMTYAPLLITLIGIVVAFCKMIKAIQDLKNVSKEEKDALLSQLKTTTRENCELKKQINKVLESIDHLKRGE